MNVKIVQRPTGEAPEWVRDAWIGLSLPIIIEHPCRSTVFGVLSRPQSGLRELWAVLAGKGAKATGYVVNAKAAVDYLAGSHPEAAAWWRENTPGLLNGKRNFLFDTGPCERDPHRLADS